MKLFKKLFIFIILVFSNINFTFADTFFKHGRIILLGNSGSGKTAFIRAIIDKQNASEFIPPSTQICPTKLYQLNFQRENNMIVMKFEIEDYPGQEKFISVVPSYFRGAHIAFVFVPLHKEINMEKDVIEWINDAINESKNENIAIVVFGTFSDFAQDDSKMKDHSLLSKNERLIKERLADFNPHRIINYCRITNTKHVHVINTVNQVLMDDCYDKIENSLKDNNGETRKNGVVLTTPKEKGGCC